MAEVAAELEGRSAWPMIAGVLLALLVGGVYLWTMLPGTADADAAEMQLMTPLLGVCHEPGYPFQVLAGYFFSFLPIGASIAWRLNVMVVLCGVIGVLALYGAIRRSTGQVLPAVVGALTLAFSDVWWAHALSPEVYVFYGMFLALAVYCAVRFALSDESRWLYLMVACLGICISNRPSELLVAPAFLLLWLAFRRRVHMNATRWAVTAALAVGPLVFSLGYHLVREQPTLLHARDDVLRDQYLQEVAAAGGQATQPAEPELTWGGRLSAAFDYVTARKWVEAGGKPNPGLLQVNLTKLWRLLSGHALWYKPEEPPKEPPPMVWMPTDRTATAVGPAGLLLVLAGLVIWRRHWGWLALGLGLTAGNLAFYLYHAQHDNLDFISPALMGAAYLTGLGATGGTGPRIGRVRRGFQWLCLACPLTLLLGNYSRLNRNTDTEAGRQELLALIAAAPLPPKSAVVTMYPSAMVLRQLYHIEAERTDVHVILWRYKQTPEEMMALNRVLYEHGHAVFYFRHPGMPIIASRAMAETTERELWKLGFVRASPKPAESQPAATQPAEPGGSEPVP